MLFLPIQNHALKLKFELKSFISNCITDGVERKIENLIVSKFVTPL